MAVYFAALFTFGFYLSAVPVKLALIVRIASPSGFGAGIAIFENRFALKKAGRRARGEKKPKKKKKAGPDAKKIASALRFAHHIFKNMRLEQLHAQGRIGLSDAAQTALVCGLTRAAEGALGANMAPGAVRFAVDPDFSGGGCELFIWGMFSISVGHIILGALNSAWDNISRRIDKWTSTPLKIS